jgi:predicted acyltransferase
MTPPAPVENVSAKMGRLMSVDALRGFDMFWIIGADELVEGLRKVGDNPVIQGVAHQLEHCAWEGFHFEDLIFPMFVFLVGVSLVFSLTRLLAERGRAGAVSRILRRALLLYLFGILVYGGFSTPFHEIRLLGVLQRIALAYLFTGLIFCFFQLRGQIIWCVGLLAGYWAVMTFVPFPGGAAGNFAEGHNLANWLDSQYLPLRKWDGDHDPEGLLSTLPAIASCLLGVFAGRWLRDSARPILAKAGYLAAAGAALLICGWLWNLQFPVIKKIWTSSFVLVAGGNSCLLLAAFYLIIDGWGWRAWAQPFVWIGMNPITIYLISSIVDIGPIERRFTGGDLRKLYFGHAGELIGALTGLLLLFALARFMYQRKIFLRV